MDTLAPIAVDPAGASLSHFLVFVFPQRRARAEAIALARAAAVFAEGDAQGRPSYFAAFDKTAEQASLALRLQSHLRNRDYVDQYAGGKRLDARHTDPIIACYADAQRCGDTRAHCITITSRRELYVDISHPAAAIFGQLLDELGLDPPAPKRFHFPCSYLLERGFRLDADHPADDVSQIRAGAVKHGCDWCPLFFATDFHEIA